LHHFCPGYQARWRVPWPPTIGQRLPGAEQGSGIGEKLAAYCLNLDHEIGGPKARGFQRILGIGIADLEYLAETLRTGVLAAPITDVRDNAPFGVLCEVRIPVRCIVGPCHSAMRPGR